MNGWLKTTVGAALAGVVAVIATGCGTSDSSSTPGSATAEASSPSKAAFIAKANAACLHEIEGSLERVVDYQQKHRLEGLPQPVLVRRAVRPVLLSTIAAEIADIDRLEPPAGDEEEIEAILAAQRRALAEAKARTKSLEDAEDYFVAADRMLREYGIAHCEKGTGD